MFDFLKNVTIAEDVKAKKVATRTAKSKNPTEADLRIFRNGSIYPSAALVAELNLEYRGKDAETGNGLDLVDSRLWHVSAAWPQQLLMVAAIGKKEGKVDVFSQVKYDEAGAPMFSVLEQGSNLGFGKELLKTIGEIYGKGVNDEGYLDLVIARDYPINTPNNIYHLPKKQSRGDNKGDLQLVKREHITLFPLAPIDGSADYVAPDTDEVEGAEGGEEQATQLD